MEPIQNGDVPLDARPQGLTSCGSVALVASVVTVKGPAKLGAAFARATRGESKNDQRTAHEDLHKVGALIPDGARGGNSSAMPADSISLQTGECRRKVHRESDIVLNRERLWLVLREK